MPDGAGWKAIDLESVPGVAWRDTELCWHPVRAALGTRVAGMAVFTATYAGQEVVEGHAETEGRGHEEIYIVLRGAARFTLGGVDVDAPSGTFVLVADPAVHRRAVASEADTAVLALGGPPTFEPAADEWIERARPLLSRDLAGARGIIDELRVARPDSPGVGIGEALLLLAQGDEHGARKRIATVLAAHPSARPGIRSDADLAPLLE